MKSSARVFCCSTGSDTFSSFFPLFVPRYLCWGCLRNKSGDVGFGKPRLILAVFPNLEPLSDLQCDVKVLVGPVSPRLRQSPNPGEAREMTDERGESGAPGICCPPWAPSPWLGRITRLCSHPRAFGEGLKQGNDRLHPVTGKTIVFS